MTNTSILSNWLNRLIALDYDPQAQRYVKALENAGCAPMGATYQNGRAYAVPISQPAKRSSKEPGKSLLMLGRVLNIKMAIKTLTEYEQRNHRPR
jgi:hypothetical protein